MDWEWTGEAETCSKLSDRLSGPSGSGFGVKFFKKTMKTTRFSDCRFRPAEARELQVAVAINPT